jgi:cell division protein FtsQ
VIGSVKKGHTARALEVKERKRQRIKRARLQRAGTLGVATALSLAAIGLLGADQLFRPDAFVVEDLSVSGKFVHVEPGEIEEVVTPSVSGNFFAVDLNEVERAAKTVAWVRDATVRRDWPRGVAIIIQEHIPTMRWGSDEWVTAHGAIVKLPDTVDIQDPIRLDGPDSGVVLMLERTLEWEESLAEIGLDLSKVTLTSRYSWTLVIRAGIDDAAYEFELMLGRDDTHSRMERFNRVYRRHLIREKTRLVRVDARYPNGMTVTRATLVAQDGREGRDEKA